MVSIWDPLIRQEDCALVLRRKLLLSWIPPRMSHQRALDRWECLDVVDRRRAYGKLAAFLLAFLGAGCSHTYVKPPFCGNGVVESPEECDDGNRVGGDGCSPFCTLEHGEICDNYEDDDGDGQPDCADPECQTNPWCSQPREICNDSVDDDGDGLADCADPDCAGTSFCRAAEVCDNGADDDGDGATDCEDEDCAGLPLCGACDPATDLGVLNAGDATEVPFDVSGGRTLLSCAPGGMASFEARFELAAPAHLSVSATAAQDVTFGLVQDADPGETCDTLEWACTQEDSFRLYHLPPGVYRFVVESGLGTSGRLAVSVLDGDVEYDCDDGVDEDADGATDCDDTDCSAQQVCVREDCSNGADDDGDGATDCEDEDCTQDPACLPPEDCGNGVDDDLDGTTDCGDLDCVGTEACRGGQCVVNQALGTLSRGASVAWDFDTSLAPDLGDTGCGDGPEEVASFELLGRALVVFDATQTGQHVLALETEAGPGHWCDEAELACVASGGAGEPIHFAALLPPARYFVTVEASSPDATGTGRVGLQVLDASREVCREGLDEDGDGLTDCQDPDCASDAACLPEGSCHDGLDEDGDGLTDCADLDCLGDPACTGSSCVPDRDLGSLAPGRTSYVVGSTVDASDVVDLPCGPGPGPERVYVVHLSEPAGLTLRLTQALSSDHSLAVALPGGPGAGCGQWVHLCTPGAGPGLPLVARVPDAPAGTYEIVIQAYGSSGAGSFGLEVDAE